MRQSRLFTKTRREAPKDEVSRNAELLIRAGFLHKEMAGVYTYLPLGLRVFNNIMNIIREEMNKIGGQEMFMTTLQSPEIWKKSGRWDDAAVDNWFKTTLKNGNELGIAHTHEEALTSLLTEYTSSYKDFPIYAYQFQNKFRNELRTKSGIMRTREFVMKDLYSFSRNEEEFRKFYEKCAEAYLKIFSRVGLEEITYRAFASGGSFSKFSDEFQTVSEAGEDIIYIHEKKRIAVNKEVCTDEVLKDLGFKKEELREAKSIEVGNIFPLGTRYSEAFGLMYKDKRGENKPVIMGSYGIGLGRLMGTVVEVLSDEKGIAWPESISPFAVHLIALTGQGNEIRKAADELYDELIRRNIQVFYDDRDDKSAGEKFQDADLIGIPLRAVVSKDTVKKKKVEIKKRAAKSAFLVSPKELFKLGSLLSGPAAK